MSSAWAQSQTLITGTVVDQDNNPLTGANVVIKGSYDGTVSGTDGRFKLKTSQKGKKLLVSTYIGYSEFKTEVELNGSTLEINIKLKEKPNELNSVVCQAGTFGASDSKKAVKLSAYDILTTASAVGDVYGAMHTFPGTSTVGEDGGLFVRGGEGYETKTFMDGMLVHKPYTSKMPDLPSRGRFSPQLFNGTTFSTGGYTAEYGQAMSSALILTSTGIADKPITSIGILPFGGNFSKTFKSDSASLALSADYYNLSPYFAVVKQDVDWDKKPVNTSGGAIYRQILNNGALVKSYLYASHSKSSLWMQNYDNISQRDLIGLNNDNIYSNTTIIGKLNADWDYKAGIAFTYDNEEIKLNNNVISNKETDNQLKFGASKNITEKARFKTGIEVWTKHYRFGYANPAGNINYTTNFTNYMPATFIELEYLFSKKFSSRIGVRAEYSSLTQKMETAPRVSLAFQTSTYSQVSFATGIFFQTPENEYLRFNNQLSNERAIHYIFNYQYLKDEVTFRIEGYYKDYAQLVKYDSLNSINPAYYHNNGYGYARGIDIFFRKNNGMGKDDFWVSYSFLDTKRNYHNFPSLATPSRFPKHTLSVAYKKMIESISTLIGFTNIICSGRTYTDPNKTGFMNSQTGYYDDLSFSASYITKLFRQETVVHFSISNVLGLDNTFGYHFSSKPGTDGLYNAYAIKPGSKRFILFGLFVSIQ